MNHYQNVQETLRQYHQEHLLAFFDTLEESQQQTLIRQLQNIDFSELAELIDQYVLYQKPFAVPEKLDPAPYFPLEPRNAEEKELFARADAAGADAIHQGKVACLTVAGGQGSRLGFDGPKGTYPIAPLSGKTLFQYFAESIQGAQKFHKCTLQWYIMTSELNDCVTRKFFYEHNYFGLQADQVHFFTQGTMPAIGYDGKLLLANAGSLALSPDGHGGTLLALRRSGMLDDMRSRGIEYMSYFQVDNPLVPVVNQRFIGLHVLEASEMSAIMLAKNAPKEKVGVFCVSEGKLMVIEYSDLPDRLARETDETGKLRYLAGSPAIHVLSRAFVERLTASGRLSLPYHRADKKIACLDPQGHPVAPAEPNGVKLESFIFDALQFASQTMILEADRKEVFAPTKNPTGVDSVESCRLMLMERDARRLERAGVAIPRKADGTLDLELELSPLAVWSDLDAEQYVKSHGITELKRGSRNYLE